MKVVIVDHSHEDCSTEVGILRAAGHDVVVTQVHDEDDVIAALQVQMPPLRSMASSPRRFSIPCRSLRSSAIMQWAWTILT